MTSLRYSQGSGLTRRDIFGSLLSPSPKLLPMDKDPEWKKEFKQLGFARARKMAADLVRARLDPSAADRIEKGDLT